MKKTMFDIIIFPLSISSNIIVDYFIMAFIGTVAYKASYEIVGQIGTIGELGSILHWIIRFILVISLWIGLSSIIYISKKYM
jgi:hypothetical protein